MTWLAASAIVILMWGVVGLLQKLGSNHSSSNSLFVWTTAGYLLLLPFLFHWHSLAALSHRDLLIAFLCGLTNALGAWCLYSALEKGAAASVAVPLTALNPLITILLAAVFLHERLTPRQSIGITLALIAAVMLSMEDVPQPALPSNPHANHR